MKKQQKGIANRGLSLIIRLIRFKLQLKVLKLVLFAPVKLLRGILK